MRADTSGFPGALQGAARKQYSCVRLETHTSTLLAVFKPPAAQERKQYSCVRLETHTSTLLAVLKSVPTPQALRARVTI